MPFVPFLLLKFFAFNITQQGENYDNKEKSDEKLHCGSFCNKTVPVTCVFTIECLVSFNVCFFIAICKSICVNTSQHFQCVYWQIALHVTYVYDVMRPKKPCFCSQQKCFFAHNLMQLYMNLHNVRDQFSSVINRAELDYFLIFKLEKNKKYFDWKHLAFSTSLVNIQCSLLISLAM